MLRNTHDVNSFRRRAGKAALIPALVAAATLTMTAVAEANQPAKPQQDAQQRIVGHLAAGEFGPALEIATNLADANKKSAMLKLVADAQMEAGEVEAAARTLRRIPNARQRSETNRRHLREVASAAGGNGANFTQLINLIQNETSGPWFEVEGVGGTMSQMNTGVEVNPNGLLSFLTRQEFGGRLRELGIHARAADLNENMAKPSKLRLVSLTRLEKEIRKRMAEGKSPVETMKNLAGLYKIEYVFVYPDTGEIVIGGPAAGWEYNQKGQPVSATNGKPTLQLDDFVTVFRIFSPEGNRYYACRIVPRQQNMKKVKAIASTTGPLARGAIRGYVNRLEKALGLQDVQFDGVPVESRVARVIVEADYRMKLIGVDKVDAGRNIPSYFDLLAKNPQKGQPSFDALRWWLTMKYSGVSHSADRNVYRITGSSVMCRGLNEKITPDGKRIHTGKADPMNRLFALNFTNHYDDLAKRDLIFADLQNIFDLSLVAALIRHERIDAKANWTGGVFAPGGMFQPAEYEPPKTVHTVANYRRYPGGNIVIQAAGGVTADLWSVVSDKTLRRQVPRLGTLSGVAKAPKLPEGRWWWDAKLDTLN